MKMMSCNPTFLEGCNQLLAAEKQATRGDRKDVKGVYYYDVYAVFAKYGLGEGIDKKVLVMLPWITNYLKDAQVTVHYWIKYWFTIQKYD
jgi:hypothetical protein